jgi:glycosyltransferase involved in cell wall biosynthesis
MKTAGKDNAPTAVDKIKILQIVKWLSPSENTGGKIRACRIGKALSSFAVVDAAGFVLPGEEPTGKEDHLSHYNRLYPFPVVRGTRFFREVFTSFSRGHSLRTARFLPGAFGPFVENILRENHYDAIQVEELPLMAVCDSIDLDIPVIFSSHNVESELSRRLFRRRNPFIRSLAGVEYGRTMREERDALARAHASLAVSEKDRDSLRQLFHDNVSPIHVLPNCAHDRFQPSVQKMLGRGMLTVGSFGWYPNREGLMWFVDKVLPLLRKKFPEEIIRVVGSEMGPSLCRKLKRQAIDVHADVPDILPFLQEARLLFVPLRIGGGTRIKIVEAWAAGLPVVSTTLGAEGLPYRPGVNILMADDETGFASEMSRLLEDDNLYRNLRSEGLEESRKLRWSTMNPLLAEIYRNVMKDREVVAS